MLNALILENFKAFGERQVIPFAPITLIFGANSAGKSSILQALLLLKQTIDEGEDRGNVLLPAGKLTDLGSFRDLIFRHDLDTTCEISPLINADRALAASLFWGHEEAVEDLPNRLGIGIRAHYDRDAGRIVPASLPVYLDSMEPAYRLDLVDSSQMLEYMQNGLSFGYPMGAVPRDAEIPIKIGRIPLDLDRSISYALGFSPEWVDPAAYRNAHFVAPTAFAEDHSSWHQGFSQLKAIVQEGLRHWLELLEKGLDGPNIDEETSSLISRYSDYDQRAFFDDVHLLNERFCTLRGFLPRFHFEHRYRQT